MRVIIDQSKSKRETLICELAGRRHFIYSRYNPERDGERFFHENHREGSDFYIFLGIGLGYHIAPFLKEREVQRVVILEPQESIYSSVEKVKGVRELLKNKKVVLYRGERVWHFVEGIKNHYDYLFYGKIRVMAYEPLKKLFFKQYKQLEEAIGDALSSLANDGLTIGKFARLWINNFYRNTEKLRRIELISSLYNRWRGAAVVTAAGPSLDRSLLDIRKNRKRIFLIATDASVQPLIGEGIKPDLIVTLDPQSYTFLHFAKFNSNDMRETPVVINLLCTPVVFNLFRTRYIYFTFHPLSLLFDTVLKNRGGVILNYRSVASLALRVAILMGFEDIYMSGFDFSYPMMRLYAKNSFFYENSITKADRFVPFLSPEGQMLGKTCQTVDGYEGQALRTNPNLLDYLKEIEEMVITEHDKRVRIFNLNPLGACIKGIETVESLSLRRGIEQEEERRISMPLEFRGAMGEGIRQNLLLTLALRNRIYKKMATKQIAFESAEAYIQLKCE